MTASLAIAVLGGGVGVLLALLRAGRFKEEAADLRGKLRAAENEVVNWKSKTADLGMEIERLRKIGIEESKRSVVIEESLKGQIADLNTRLTLLLSKAPPGAVRDELNDFFKKP